jgi:two-component system cell cycle sensor histidine kinase/response regulator CckA
MTHQLLQRQLKKSGLSGASPPCQEDWTKFLSVIDKSYADADQDRYLLERSLAISSQEMQELYENLKQASEEKYRSIFEGVQDAIIVGSPGGKIIDANGRACEMYGYAYSELTNMSLADIVPEEHLKFVQQQLGKENLLDRPFETVNLRANGEHFPVEVSARREQIDEKDMILTVIRDITERKHSEAALIESESKFRDLAEKSPNMIFINQAGRIVYANRACEETMGYSRDEFYASDFNFMTLFCQECLPEIKDYFKQHLAGKEIPPYESVLMTKDSNQIHAIHTTRLISYEGAPAILGIVTDVTEHKRAEAAIAKRAAEMAILNEISGQIAGVLELENLLRRTVEIVQENFNFEHVAIFLHDFNEDTLVMRARAGVYSDLFPAHHTLKMGQGMVGWVASTGDSLLVNDVRTDKRYINFYPKEVKTLSELSVPIKVGKKVVGVLDLQSRETEAFDLHDTVVMETLVDQLAAAIENVRLYEEIQHELAERKRVLEALRHSEANYRSIFEGVHDALIVESMNGEILDVNSRACEMYGWEYEDFLRLKIADLFPTGSLELQPQELEKKALQEASFETINARADGSHFHVEIAARLQNIEDDLVMLVLVRDITERKMAEEELVRSTERLRIVYEYAPDAYYLSDLRGIFIDGNSAAERTIGYSKEEMIGKSFLEVGLLDKKDIPRAAALLGKNVVGQSTGPDIFELTRKDGERVTVEISTYPVKIEGKTLVLGIARNITDRIRAEAAVRESEERFRSVAETAVDAIVIMDDHGIVRYWNKAAQVIFEYGEAEVINQRVDLIIPGENLDLHQVGMLQSRQSEERKEIGDPIELYGKKKSGETFPVELSLAAWTTREGEFTSAIIRDVSSKRDAYKREQLQNRLAAVGQLAAGIAHDFNNILGTIILYSELMLKGEALPLKDRERLETIFNQAQRGANLTAQILDFGRKSVMELHQIDLIPFFKDLENLLSRTLPENVKMTFSYNGGNNYFVKADPTRMQQIIMNLALNSRDAMPNGGELKIDVNQITVEEGAAAYRDMQPGEWIRIRVIDTGHGISRDIMAHIFEPFFTTKPSGQGTGLGLAQVYGIVKQHDGYIEADSEVSVGTTFTIYFPAVTEEVSRSLDVETTPAPSGSGETILVVEDDHATRMAIREILTSMGYEVMHVADGMEALNTLEIEHSNIKLIISDLVMPNLGGRDLYDAVVDRYPQMKMIIMTGYPLGTHTRELLDRRRVTWLQKPLTTDSLSEAVRQMLA